MWIRQIRVICVLIQSKSKWNTDSTDEHGFARMNADLTDKKIKSVQIRQIRVICVQIQAKLKWNTIKG